MLPLELQRYIEEDNWRVEQEMAELEEQSCKMAQIEQSSGPVESQNLSSDSSQGEKKAHSVQKPYQQTGSEIAGQEMIVTQKSIKSFDQAKRNTFVGL